MACRQVGESWGIVGGNVVSASAGPPSCARASRLGRRGASSRPRPCRHRSPAQGRASIIFAKAKSAKGVLKPQDLQRFTKLIADAATVCDTPPTSDKITAKMHAVIPMIYVIPSAAESNLSQTYKQACCNISRKECVDEPLYCNDSEESYKPLQDKASAEVRQLEYNCLTLSDENTCNDKALSKRANLYLGKEEKNARLVPQIGDTLGCSAEEQDSRHRTPLPAEKWGRRHQIDRAIWALRASAGEKRRGPLWPIIETVLRRTPQLVFEGSALRAHWLVPENKNTAPP